MKSRSKQMTGAAIAGAIYGALCGALIGASVEPDRGTWIGLLFGAIFMGAAEAITSMQRKPGKAKAHLQRIIGTTLLGAAVGAVLHPLTGPLLTGLLIGLMLGLMALGPRRLLMAGIIGAVLGIMASGLSINGAILGGLIALIYRLLERVFFRNAEPFQLVGEQVTAEEARFVVPFEARTKYVGTDFVELLARETQGIFQRNQAGIGLVESLDLLHGPTFDPAQVDVRVRDFYEHTSNYRLTIVPEWNRLMRPLYRLFKQSIAQQIGQANLPFDLEEAQRGVVSYIDTIAYAGSTPDEARTLRAWIRAFETTGEAIYVGIYTVVRHEDVGYISVGFPFPEGNFSTTLLPYNHPGGGLLLKTHGTSLKFPGHYLSDIDNDTGALTIVKLPTMDEEIEVFVQDEQVRTNHRFYLGGRLFLTLVYTIVPKTDTSA